MWDGIVCGIGFERGVVGTKQDSVPASGKRPATPSLPTHLSAGVHRNTKVYMAASNRDCIAPSSAILGSAVEVGR